MSISSQQAKSAASKTGYLGTVAGRCVAKRAKATSQGNVASSSTTTSPRRFFFTSSNNNAGAASSGYSAVIRRRLSVAFVSGIVLSISYMLAGYKIPRPSILLDSAGVRNGNSKQFSSTSGDSVPLVSNNPTGGGKSPIVRLTDEQVTARLRQLEESYLVDRGRGVVRYDVAQLPSNNPIEDERKEQTLEIPLAVNGNFQMADIMFWGIFDGHGGWSTSAKLRESLISHVARELDQVLVPGSKVPTEGGGSIQTRIAPSPEAIDKAIEKGFLSLDDEIVNKNVQKLLSNPTKAAAAQYLMPAFSGSCGLLAVYDSYTHLLRLALVGDSRAVLGHQTKDGTWEAKVLTDDQTGSNPREVARMRKEHPGEEDSVISRGRVLGGLEPTRAFGDARYKWSAAVQKEITEKFFGRRQPQQLRSPPYVSAKPEITSVQVHPEQGDFLVLGSDGLFELMSNTDVVKSVVDWIKTTKPKGITYEPPSSSLLSDLFGRGGSDSTTRVVEVPISKAIQKTAFRKGNNNNNNNTAIEDLNVSTHLIRNALGGKDTEQVSMLTSIPSPLSRSYRDDLTVTVVFFGNNPNNSTSNGNITVNREATNKLYLDALDQVATKNQSKL